MESGVICPSLILIKKPTHSHTLKTRIPIEDGDSILKLLRRVSCPETGPILGVGIHLHPFPKETQLFSMDFSLVYTLLQKKGNLRNVAFLLEKSVFNVDIPMHAI